MVQPAQRKVLIVDDEKAVGRALSRLLKRFSLQCAAVETAAQGLELLAADPFDVVITDQRMPQMTGTSFLRTVRTGYPGLLRILMTGWMDEQELEGAQADGTIELLLAKPWVEEDIQGLVRWIDDNVRS